MITVVMHFNEDYACFEDDLWYEIDRMMNIMKQNVYRTIKDQNSNTVRMSLCDEASGPIVESNGNTCGDWKVTKRYGESC